MVEKGGSFLLLPGQAVLGITEENIQMSPNICGLLGTVSRWRSPAASDGRLTGDGGLLEGRSRFARLGLFVHITAGFIQPGVNNRQVLEIYNSSLVRFGCACRVSVTGVFLKRGGVVPGMMGIECAGVVPGHQGVPAGVHGTLLRVGR